MKFVFGKLIAAVGAIAVILTLSGIVASQGKPNKPKPPTAGQERGDLDRDRDRDRDQDSDMDRDRDRDRDRISSPMSRQDKETMMRQVRSNRNHLMADGYRRNMLVFAEQLRYRLEEREAFDRGFAKGAVAEIKRNFRELEKRHKAHKKEMGAQMREQMSEMIRSMEEHHDRIRNTIRTLENDCSAPSPDSRQMLMHVRQLEEQLRTMEQERERNYSGSHVPVGGAVIEIALSDML